MLETKARVRRKAIRTQKEHVVIYDGRALVFPWCEDRDAVQQASRNAAWLREFIADFGPKDILVQPVVVVPGWFVETKGDFPVKAMNAEYLAKSFLPSAKRIWSPDELRPILRRLEDCCRDVEF